MNNNSNENVSVENICSRCLVFFANPKLGSFCSSCYSDISPDSEFKIEIKKEQNEDCSRFEFSTAHDDMSVVRKLMFFDNDVKPIQVSIFCYLMILKLTFGTFCAKRNLYFHYPLICK